MKFHVSCMVTDKLKSNATDNIFNFISYMHISNKKGKGLHLHKINVG